MDAQDLDLIALLFQQNSITDKTMKNNTANGEFSTHFVRPTENKQSQLTQTLWSDMQCI